MGFLSQVVRDARPRPMGRTVGSAARSVAPEPTPLTYARLMESNPEQPGTSPGLDGTAQDEAGAVLPEEPDQTEEALGTASNAAQPTPTQASQPPRTTRASSRAPGTGTAATETAPDILHPRRVHTQTDPAHPSARPKKAQEPHAERARGPATSGSERREISETITPDTRLPPSADTPADTSVRPGTDPDDPQLLAALAVSEKQDGSAAGAVFTPPAPISPEIRMPVPLPPGRTAAVPETPHLSADAPTEVRIGQVEIVVQEPVSSAARPRPSPPAVRISPSRYHVRRM